MSNTYLATLSVSSQIYVVTCGGCGWLYGIPLTMQERAKSHGLRWRCPNRECLWASVGYNESDLDQLKKQVERAQQGSIRNREWAEREKALRETAERSNAALRGVNGRLKKRAAHGVCPCCKRTFSALSAHMKSKHPDFVESSS